MEPINTTGEVVAIAVPIQPNSDVEYHGFVVTAEPIYNIAIPHTIYASYPHNSNVVVPDFGTLTLRQHQLIEIYKASRFMLLISSTHFLIIILFLFIYTFWYILILVIPLTAYYGCKNYSSTVLCTYVIYSVVEIIISSLSFFIYTAISYLIVRGLYIIYLIYALRYSIKLIRAYNLLDQSDIDFLKHSTIITNLNNRIRAL